MKMKKTFILALSAFLGISLASNAKKVLSHTDFDDWKRVTNYSISNNGEWAAYAMVPQEGDATLVFYNTRTKKHIMVERGYKPSFTSDSRYAVSLIKPLFADSRKAKIDKKKGLDLPQDSMAIIDLKKGEVEKIANVKGFKVGEKGGEWLAYLSVDTIYAKKKLLKDKEAGKPLIVRQLGTKNRKVVNWVSDYNFSKDGKKLAFTIKRPDGDTLSTNGLGLIQLPDTSFTLISREMPFYGSPVFNEHGSRLAFTTSADSIETGTRKCRLYLTDINNDSVMTPKEIKLTLPNNRPAPNLALPRSGNPEEQKRLEQTRKEMLDAFKGPELFINQYSKPVFSHNGKRLVIGVAPYVAPDDTTIVDFERADLDIWRWDAPYTPPMENKLVDELREKTYPVVINLDDYTQNLIYISELQTVSSPDRWDGEWALVADPSAKIISRQWDYNAPENLWSVNVNNGNLFNIGDAPRDEYVLSPAGRFVVWFDKRNYYSYDNATHSTVEISSKVDYPLWDTDDDHPCPSPAFGIAAWSKDDRAILVYDKYDIWSLDPTGETAPECLTKGEGRKKNIRFRLHELDKEQRFLNNGDLMVLDVFDYTTKENGLATMTYGKPMVPSVKMIEKASYTQIRKSKNNNVFSWQMASFDIAPDIWLSTNTDFAKAIRLTEANPQQKDYSWGTAQLFKWHTYQGYEAEGVLYLPEDFSADKEYPMLSVFYETSDEDLYRHYTMEPSWSWVNYPFYVSRGYVVFVPSIKYYPGLPGESCYDYVCSGVEALCDAYPNIDRKRLGIDGQSWGGYQTAYLVTRTDMFACAGSGAPVSNMTSAFGGIRWGTGDSRQAQYEMGQSRIGRNLWDAPELYIANSPLFKANRVETPLLIMHNDADGAVPWYQGIEFFMALRRLNKPVWMLQYNGEAHNIKDRKNRKDITIRLQQFFDHYLKGDPMPEWMKTGIPAIRKGQEMRTGY